METNFFALKRSGQHAIIFWYLNNLECELVKTDIKGVMAFWDESKKICYLNDDIVGRPKDPRLIDFNLVIRNFEDKKFFGKGITIVRDFLNTLCSRNAHAQLKKSIIKDFDNLVHLWKDYVNKKCIIYNRWLFDADYRNAVSSDLNVKNKDNVEFVSSIGGGSSFIGLKKEKDEKKYILRYKFTKLPKIIMEKILSDKEMLYINKNIFDIDIRNIYHKMI